MKGHSTAKLIAAALCALLALAACAALIFRAGRLSYGQLNVRVIDAYTLKPLQNAHVLIPEHAQAVTGENGYALLTGIPVVSNQAQAALLEQDWGESTLLAYADGYLPYALFYAHIPDGSLREGPTIYMFPLGSEDDIDCVTVIESPGDEWTKALLDKYRPEM